MELQIAGTYAVDIVLVVKQAAHQCDLGRAVGQVEH